MLANVWGLAAAATPEEATPPKALSPPLEEAMPPCSTKSPLGAQVGSRVRPSGRENPWLAYWGADSTVEVKGRRLCR